MTIVALGAALLAAAILLLAFGLYRRNVHQWIVPHTRRALAMARSGAPRR